METRREKVRRGELLRAPVGYIKTEDQRLKRSDLRMQQAIVLVFRKFMELGTVRQTLMWFLNMACGFRPERAKASGLKT